MDTNSSVSLQASFPNDMTVADRIGLTVYQQQLLIKMWPRISAPGAIIVGNSIMRKLLECSERSKTMLNAARAVEAFSETTSDIQTAHALYIVELLEFAVKSLQDPVNSFHNRCIEIGQCHKQLTDQGMGPNVWHNLADAIQEYVYKNDAVRKHKMLAKAWNMLITFMIDWIAQGQTQSTPP